MKRKKEIDSIDIIIENKIKYLENLIKKDKKIKYSQEDEETTEG